ncbi:hypothetical protein F0562_020112 [Nyssa sinensis]|uniref:HMG box domain-containing protein n=1 Tax=Nyssa sinensis TaxID=561372 RepID=A0A5J5BR55_9ASTE|nr:hypothetical protein F0562_020112 [Nyssa sinensis]
MKTKMTVKGQVVSQSSFFRYRIHGKTAKDPNKPKRPASAFFVFMEEFRKQYKEKHADNKFVSVVGKAGGDKWKSLSEAEKVPM